MVLPHPLIAIQCICTIWTKASRGGANAVARNCTPGAFELPFSAPQYPDDVFLLHEVIYTEDNCFQYPLEKHMQRKRTDPCWYNCLRFSPSENALSVTLEWERNTGAPRRPILPRTAWSLQENQWGCLIYNLRHAGEDHWIYHKYVISIGFFHFYSPRIFLETKPAHTYRDMAQLW